MKMSHIVISMEEAEIAARYLERMRPTDPADPRRAAFKNISDALWAITNDTDFIVTDEAVVPERPASPPDYVYYPDDWEVTYQWDIRSQLVDDLGVDIGKIFEVGTLIEGPSMYLAVQVSTWDDEGCPDYWQVEWFSSKEAAEAVVKAQFRLPWIEQVQSLRGRLGRNPTLGELLELARGYTMTRKEIEEQQASWARQTMD